MKKNVFWMIAFMLCFVCGVNAQTEELFNGKDLSNWRFIVDGDKAPANEVYMIRDGFIHIQGTPFGYMYTEKKYKDYTLEVEWRWIGEATNSGIFMMIAEPKQGNAFPTAIECQLKGGDAGDFVMLSGSDLDEYVVPANGRRPAFPVIKKRQDSNEKSAGEWNQAKIEVKDGKITVYINGVLQNQGTNKVKEGHIGLQSEGGPVQFRNVKVSL